MRYLKTTDYFTKPSSSSRFTVTVFNPDILLTIVEETSSYIIATYIGDSYIFDLSEPVEIFVQEVPMLMYELWYKGERTKHIFSIHNVTDIRTLGYDVNEIHEFKIKMVIT